MAYNDDVARRLRSILADAGYDVTERKMFGGIAFMLSGHMCCGVIGDEMLARVGPNRYDESLTKPHVSKMNFTGRSMKGFVFIAPQGFESEEDLRGWVALCADFVKSLPPK